MIRIKQQRRGDNYYPSLLGWGTPLLWLLVAALSLSAVAVTVAAAEFQPYQLNGGLVSAVAGSDFVVIASDTRLTSDGYDILQRNHLSSRLWVATTSTTTSTTTADSSSVIHHPDGSIIALPSSTAEEKKKENNEVHSSSSSSYLNECHKATVLLPESQPPPVLVGSAGCSADCEMLKRTVRSDLRAAHYFAECRFPHPDQVATLLGQILYSRRGFPFYSFCVVAGLEEEFSTTAPAGTGEGEGGGGRVFVYDAIGSYENVAVATAGTGRELLQPILDRRFRSIQQPQQQQPAAEKEKDAVDDDDDDDTINGKIAQMMRKKSPPRCIPSTQVDCSKEEAVSVLIDAYRAVSEREIGVGDQLVLCVLARRKRQQQQHCTNNNEGSYNNKPDGAVECQVFTTPLKEH